MGLCLGAAEESAGGGRGHERRQLGDFALPSQDGGEKRFLGIGRGGWVLIRFFLLFWGGWGGGTEGKSIGKGGFGWLVWFAAGWVGLVMLEALGEWFHRKSGWRG